LESLADGVVILAETESSQYIIIKEHRYPVSKKIYSLPGGRLDPKESPIEGAKREFLEETGFEAASWKLLGEYYPFPSVSDQKIWVFWAKGLKKTSEPIYDPLEQLSCSCLTREELLSLEPEQGKLDSTIPMALFFKSQLA
jgi:ADP-ribose pyrophosphatase